ncbi:MAG: hypothetical protein HY832_02515 [Candidatus Aenigmarchaeota archaeon]|nr:hypothetical protein [Candidatus Aenigmarchaeota archaeon]
MKGQMFLIAALLLVIGLVLIKGFITTSQVTDEQARLDQSLDEKKIQNIEREYEEMIALSTLSTTPNVTAVQYLSNFSSWLRDIEDIKILSLAVFMNGSTQQFSVSVVNYLDDKINVTINVTNSTVTGAAIGTLNDKTNSTTSFSAAMNGSINITLTYLLQGTNVQEQIAVDSTKNTGAGFFDIQLTGDPAFRIKRTYNRTWP